MRNQTIRVNFIIQKGKLNKEGKCPIMAQITINREMKYLGTKQFVLPERWDYGKTLGLSRDDKRINLVLEEIKHNILETHTALFGSVKLNLLYLRVVLKDSEDNWVMTY